MLNRLHPGQALDRQLRHRDAIGKRSGHAFNFKGVVTYDMLVGVDEAIVDGVRVKRRGTPETAREAVKQTILSAEYYAANRGRIGCPIFFSAQGASPMQYALCAQKLVSLMQPQDTFAFGGFCILGMQRSLLPTFERTLDFVLPLLARNGHKRAHLLGICWAKALETAHRKAAPLGIEISTDSSSIEVNSIMGKIWTKEKWIKVWDKEHKEQANGSHVDGPDGSYHPVDLTMSNLKKFNDWIGGFKLNMDQGI